MISKSKSKSNDFFANFNIKLFHFMLDTLFKSLEDKGLQLSQPTLVELPISQGKKSFYNTMLVSRNKT